MDILGVVVLAILALSVGLLYALYRISELSSTVEELQRQVASLRRDSLRRESYRAGEDAGATKEAHRAAGLGREAKGAPGPPGATSSERTPPGPADPEATPPAEPATPPVEPTTTTRSDRPDTPAALRTAGTETPPDSSRRSSRRPPRWRWHTREPSPSSPSASSSRTGWLASPDR